MTYIGNKDYSLEVAIGNVGGHSAAVVSGHQDSLGTTQFTLHPHLSIVDQSGIMGTPATVKVASTDVNDDSVGTGLRTGELSGLDSSGDAQVETITMNGQTEVTTTKTWKAVHGFEGKTWGSGKKNAGCIFVGTGTFTAGIPATKYLSADVGFNKSLTAFYVIPNGKTGWVRRLVGTIAATGSAVNLFIKTSADGIHWITMRDFSVGAGPFAVPINTIPGIPAGSAVTIEAALTSGTAEVAADLELEIITD